ncbi:MAG: zinc-binding alcohol dehydrogenase [Candidatus Latescibacteria bacterium]|nr:zinc-binding alcohol dehydrogenase [Candidatus Latescibacterota bacterium]
MPLELIADQPGHAILRAYEEPPLQPDHVRIRSLFSSVKHGTELRGFRGTSADTSARWDGELRLHVRGEPVRAQFPMPLGNMCLGVVTEVGGRVSRLKVGDRVFSHFSLRETHTVQEQRVQVAPEGVSPQSLMYWDPADFAVGGVRDGHVRLGDRVAVFGLGAIGQMVVQAARLAGARWVIAVDPIERRRDAAARHGADLTLDPARGDAGVEVKRRTDTIGVDVAFETSGSSAALYDALRSARYQGTVVSTAYYVGPAHGLLLSGEWHRNRVSIVSSRACSEPLPDYGWDFARIQSESLALLVEGRLKADDLIDPIVPFARAAEAYQEINEHPERSIKLGIDHTTEDSGR